MTALWILLGIFLFFFFLFVVPIHIIVGLSEEVSASVRILCFKIKLFPRPKRVKKRPKDPKKHAEKLAKQKAKKDKKAIEKAEKKAAKKAAKKAEKQAKAAEQPKKKRDILGLVRLLLKVVGAFLRSFPKHFKIRIHAYEIYVASEDAAKTAVMYGAIYALSQHFFTDLQRWKNFKIKRQAPLCIYADYFAEKPKANVKIEFILSIGGVLAMVLAAGVGFVKGIAENRARKKNQPAETKSADKKQQTNDKTQENTSDNTKNTNG